MSLPSETKESFLEWFENKFFKRNGGFRPKDIGKWFDQVEKTHQKLRGFLGTERVSNIYKLKSQQNPVPAEEAQPVIDGIKKLVPQYLEAHGFIDDIFLFPTRQQGIKNSIKVSKHLIQYSQAALGAGGEKIKKLQGYVSELGNLWSKYRTTDLELEITMSTTPRAFTLLGHYGPDAESCFRNGSDKTADKFCLGQTPDTFVISISKKQDGKLKDGKPVYKNLARCFGFANKDYTTFGTSNYYINPGFSEGDTVGVIRALFEDLWKDKSEFHDDMVYIYGSEQAGNPASIYQNKYGKWAFSKGAGSVLKEAQTLRVDTNHIKTFNCPRCQMPMRQDRDIYNIDGQEMCNRCAGAANRCTRTGELTFQQLITVCSDRIQYEYLHPKLIGAIKLCDKCGKGLQVEKGFTGNTCLYCLFKAGRVQIDQ
jgi:hypothetical protein